MYINFYGSTKLPLQKQRQYKIMRLFSILIQLLSFGMVLYLTYFKSDITDRDILRAIFFMGLYMVEDVRQLKYMIEDNNNKPKIND